MSWASGYYTYDLKTSRAAMEADFNESLYQERGGMEPVMFPTVLKELTFDSYEDAEEYLNEHATQNNNLGVKYKVAKETKKSKEIKERIETLEKKIAEYSAAHSVKTFKAEYIGCPSCGSKLKRTLLSSDRCPLCRTDMRSDTTITTLNGYQDKKKKLTKELAKSTEKTCEIQWLVHAIAYLG